MTAAWTLALALALFWPGRALSLLDGAPLDGALEAVVIGVIVPALWWADRDFLRRASARMAIVALLLIKVLGGVLLTQQGLCVRFSDESPVRGDVLTIPIDEPRGILRSWDVRADWRADAPNCTAILDRPYETTTALPAWFVNITDFLHNGQRRVLMDVTGYATVGGEGQLRFDLDRDMVVTGEIGGQSVSSVGGRPVEAMLAAGTHRLDLHARLTGDRWRLMPRWKGSDALRAALLTSAPATARDRWLAPSIAFLTNVLVVAIVAGWATSLVRMQRIGVPVAVWCLGLTFALVAAGLLGRFERPATVLLLGATLAPCATARRNLRTAFLLVGVPWLSLFIARSLPQVGHFSAYSNDDWLAYQVAGYRIFMNGFWLEGGSATFDYQPLYRWISGGLHLVFGDSSVGEVYWDSAWLLVGALLCFSMVKAIAGFRAGVAAAAATLAIFAMGTPWYFLGRGLSEISAAGFAFLAAGFLLRARIGRVRSAVAAGLFAVMMFYTRLNHLLFAAALPALLLPLRQPASWRDVKSGLSRINLRSAGIYFAIVACGVALFATRTWWYTGAFSVLYGTSLKNNDTGLRVATLGSAAAWARVAHSLAALIWMNEPPAPDVRALLVALGTLLSGLAVLQVPRVSRLPFALAAVTIGATASSFLAHTHNYPGRMSIHLVPFAVAVSACAAAAALPQKSGRATRRTRRAVSVA